MSFFPGVSAPPRSGQTVTRSISPSCIFPLPKRAPSVSTLPSCVKRTCACVHPIVCLRKVRACFTVLSCPMLIMRLFPWPPITIWSRSPGPPLWSSPSVNPVRLFLTTSCFPSRLPALSPPVSVKNSSSAGHAEMAPRMLTTSSARASWLKQMLWVACPHFTSNRHSSDVSASSFPLPASAFAPPFIRGPVVSSRPPAGPHHIPCVSLPVVPTAFPLVGASLLAALRLLASRLRSCPFRIFSACMFLVQAPPFKASIMTLRSAPSPTPSCPKSRVPVRALPLCVKIILASAPALTPRNLSSSSSTVIRRETSIVYVCS